MKNIYLVLLAVCAAVSANSQKNPDKVYFVDGYHGGVYGHYPLEWKTQFIVDELAEHPEWRIGLEIEPETWDSVKVHTPAAYDAFRRIAADKRVEFTNPNYAQPYAYNVSGESLIRQFEYGIRKTREHFPDVEFVTYAVEEPCFTSSLPQILRQFGYKYAVLKNPNTCWGGYTAAYGGQLVNWIGPDGTSILAVPRYAAEALEDNSVWQTKAWGNHSDYLEACRAAGIPNPVGMTYQDAGWRFGPWIGSGDSIRNNSTYVTWREYIETVTPGHTTDDYRMPLEDVRPALMWGTQVMQRIGQQVRTSENKIVIAEKTGAIAGLIGDDYRYPQAEIDEAWRTLMLAQHHDSWIVPYNRLHGKGTWADAIERWTEAANKIADRVSDEATGTARGGEYVTFYNTLGVARTEIVDIAGVSTRVEVPPFGFATYHIEAAKDEASTGGISREEAQEANGKVVLENDMYRIEIDAAQGGTISSLIANGREFAAEGDFAFGELRGHFYDEGRFRSSTETAARVTVTENGELRKTALIEGEIAGHPFRQTITIRKDDRKIDFSLDIDWQSNVGIGEFRQTDAYRNNRRAFYDDRFKLNVLFPTTLDSPTLYKDAPFDVARSGLDNTYFNTWDNIKHNIIVRWVDLSEREGNRRGHGLALLTDHTTSYTYGEDFPLALTAQFSGNGLWGRDYIIDRPTLMRFAVVPHSGSWDKADIQNESARWNEPLVAAAGDADKGSRSLVDLGRRSGYEISAAYPTEDGTLIRLYNASGNKRRRKVDFGFPVESVIEVDLNGDPVGEPLKVRSRKNSASVKISMPRFGFRTFIVAAVRPEKTPADYVNPFIGASTSTAAAGVYHGLGKTFPGATTPYGMVQVSPNTITGGDNAPGYSYEHKTIEGFAFTQMSGVGWFGDLGNLLVMPTTGEMKKLAGREDGSVKGWRSHYDKTSERAEAGYYSVELTDYDIRVESSAAVHSGILRFTFPESERSRIQIDLARRVGGTSTEQYVEVVDEHTIKGWMKCTPDGGGWGDGAGNADYTVHFYAQFSKPLTDYGFWSADIPDDWSCHKDDVVSERYLARVAEAETIKGIDKVQGRHLGFFTEFATEAGDQVEMRAGISFVDMEGAERNLRAEMEGKSFEAVRADAHEAWDRELSRIDIEGGTEDERTIFYTALYHTMIDPRIYEDTDGRYVGGDGKVHASDESFTKRTIFSGWDVFRSQFPLQTIINPQLVNDQLSSLITLADESEREYFERWEIMNAYSGCMIGNPALSVLADAYVKGIRNYDAEKGFRFAVNTSERFGNDLLGYTASPVSISHTLEYAYTDWCVARLAEAMGKTEETKLFDRKAQAYRNIFDPEKGWFRPRSENGQWAPWPENARTQEGYGCIESNPYQQGWFVPHDVEGMVELMGGRDKVLADLKAFFEQAPADMLWNDYYNHANEPVHLVPFMFNKLGAPSETQKWTRLICDRAYHNAVEGLVGNEDVGQMSAWYVLASTGIHPSCPGETRIEITSPVFDRVEFRLDGGGTFNITAHDNSAENIYIQRALLNGKEHTRCWLDFAEIAAGGKLELFMGNRPNENYFIP